MTNKHALVALVTDKPGVLNRIASLFRRRGFNIESIAVGHSEVKGISRVTIVVDGSSAQVEQVRKQFEKEVDVLKVIDVTGEGTVTRELAMIKVKASTENRSEIIQIVDIFRAAIVDVSTGSLIIEVTGEGKKIDTLYELLRKFGIKEIARTGTIAMMRSDKGSPAIEKNRKVIKNKKKGE